ncbi:MAG: SDR family NAD(P)-dependent oxidoreductase [Aestuariivita sp.]|nr:SDR family NAD(P)-dependent oxidoreductase [Aestuariivita sp.]
MRSFLGKRYWLVGASEGLGEALAKQLSAEGAHVILSSRSSNRLYEVSNYLQSSSSIVCVDIADESSVRSAAKTVGTPDGIVLLAGLYWPMKATEWQQEQVVQMADVNFTGFLRVLGMVVPKMVARDEGHIVITGSLAGFRGLSGAIGYGASKAAVMSLAESLYADLRNTGVDIQLVNPGFIQTRLTHKNNFSMPFIMQPEEAATRMLAHMRSNKFKSNFPIGFSWIFRLTQFMPDWVYYRLFS